VEITIQRAPPPRLHDGVSPTARAPCASARRWAMRSRVIDRAPRRSIFPRPIGRDNDVGGYRPPSTDLLYIAGGAVRRSPRVDTPSWRSKGRSCGTRRDERGARALRSGRPSAPTPIGRACMASGQSLRRDARSAGRKRTTTRQRGAPASTSTEYTRAGLDLGATATAGDRSQKPSGRSSSATHGAAAPTPPSRHRRTAAAGAGSRSARGDAAPVSAARRLAPDANELWSRVCRGGRGDAGARSGGGHDGDRSGAAHRAEHAGRLTTFAAVAVARAFSRAGGVHRAGAATRDARDRQVAR